MVQSESQRGQVVRKSFGALIKEHLWLKILIGMMSGVLVGYLLSPEGLALMGPEDLGIWSPWIKLPGVLFLGLISLAVVPLVLCSIILGIAQSGEMDFLKRLGSRIVPYFVLTTCISISIGLAVVHVVKPSQYMDAAKIEAFAASEFDETQVREVKTFEDLTVPQRIANLLPTNLSKAIVDKNLLQIVIAAIIIGVALVAIPKESSKPVIDLCVSGQMITMKVIGWAMVMAPYAVFGLLCDVTMKLGLEALASMGAYMACVIVGLLLMLCVYMLIVWLVAKRNPLVFLSQIIEAQIIAFSTSSSAATMPVSVRVAEENMKASPEVARFVIPLGATINMDGTALYQAVAAVFLVSVFGPASGVELSGMGLVLLLLTTVGASIGTPATPGVGIVVLSTILVGIGLNPAAVGFIIGVDRILDMCRTTINVTGDLTATAVMDRLNAKR